MEGPGTKLSVVVLVLALTLASGIGRHHLGQGWMSLTIAGWPNLWCCAMCAMCAERKLTAGKPD